MLSLRKILQVLTTLLLFVLSSCRAVNVADDITQNQANQIVSLLNSNGIAAYARRDSGGKAKYNIEVDRSYYAQAKTLLAERNLPGPLRQSLGDLVEPHGLLPNSREMEALRLDHALAIEVEDALTVHPAISNIKVVVRSHSVSDVQEKGASILIQQRTGAKLNQADVLQIVQRALPGIPPDHVLISIENEIKASGTISPDGAYNDAGKIVRVPLVPFLFNWKVPEDDYNAMVYVLIACFALLALIGGLIGYWYGYYQHSKQYMDVGLPDLGPRSLRLERPNREMPEV